jgi:hypothetical protein
VSAFYNKVSADKFRDASFVSKVPKKFCTIEGHESIDPNDVDRISFEGCNGAWFKVT